MRSFRRLGVMLLGGALGSCSPAPITRPVATDGATAGWEVAPDWPKLDRPLGRVLGVAIDPGGRVWFSHLGAGDEPRPEILAIDPESGEVVAEIDARRFESPHALAFDGRGRLWVTDDARDRVVVLDPNDPSGAELLTIGGEP